MATYEPATAGTKRCKRCEDEKAVVRFRIDRSIPDGRGSTCKDCINAAALVDPRRKVWMREWTERKKQDPKWVEAERARSRAKNRAFREADPEAARTRSRDGARKWRAENPERSRQYSHQTAVRNRAIEGGGVVLDWVERLVVLEMDDGVCGICGEDVDPFDFHVDHIRPLSKGGEHSYANVQVAHRSCNSHKHNAITHKAVA